MLLYTVFPCFRVECFINLSSPVLSLAISNSVSYLQPWGFDPLPRCAS